MADDNRLVMSVNGWHLLCLKTKKAKKCTATITPPDGKPLKSFQAETMAEAVEVLMRKALEPLNQFHAALKEAMK